MKLDRKFTHRALAPETLRDAENRASDDRELTHDIHQMIELVDLDADGVRYRTDRERIGLVRPAQLRRARGGVRERTGRGLCRCDEIGEIGGLRLLHRAQTHRPTIAPIDFFDARSFKRNGGLEHLFIARARDEHDELDMLRIASIHAGEVGDDLGEASKLLFEGLERFIDRKEREPQSHSKNRHALLYIRPQAVLLVLRKDAEHRFFETERAQRILRRASILDTEALTDALSKRVEVDAGFGFFLALKKPLKMLDALEEHVEDLGGKGDLFETELVEEILEAMRDRTDGGMAKHPRDPLERMHAAKKIVDLLSARRPFLLGLIEHEEVSRERLDDLLRLGKKFVSKTAVVIPSHRSGLLRLCHLHRLCPSSRQARRLSPGGLPR